MSAMNTPYPLLRVGLTGGIGSGKSAVARYLSSYGAHIIDTDALAHQITAPGGLAMRDIQESFGDSFIDSTGALNRTKMRELVFSDPTALARLEAITHPLIRRLTEEAAMNALSLQPAYVVFMIPLLFESGDWHGQEPKKLDVIVVVDCPKEQQIARVMARSGLERLAVEQIMAQQLTREERLAHADWVIPNDGDLEQLQRQCELTHERLLAFKNSKNHQ
jgi:dephospho-CoA kinase